MLFRSMPAFDPDSDISSLSLTIPSWISLIDRTLSNAYLDLASNKAKSNLIKMLNNLKNSIDSILNSVKE